MSAYFAFSIFQPTGRRTRGVPPTLVAKDKHCDECGRVHDFETCPLCGSWIEIGFGLAYGGFGLYKVCAGDNDCPWFWKEHYLDKEDPAFAAMSDPRWMGAGHP